jgi:hypothetical protein
MIKRIFIGFGIIFLFFSCGLNKSISVKKQQQKTNNSLEATTTNKTSISPILVGTNVWYVNPSQKVWDLTKESGVTSVRIGGHGYDVKMPSNAILLEWVNRIQAMGAEPIMQVSQYASAAEAAAIVKFFNVDLASGKPIKYWNIGNEPWLQNKKPDLATVGAMVEGYFKPRAQAMKTVDPTIKIYGPDFCYYIDEAINDLFGGKNDISGKVPDHDYYYCDGITWHRYPQDEKINLAYEGIEDFKKSIIKCKAKVDSVNLLHNRLGDDLLGWGIGEFNAKGGTQNHTWQNGQMFGGILDLCMKYGATYATSWSMFENDGNRKSTDFSFIDGAKMIPRASYRHMQMIANNFSGTYLNGKSSVDDIIVFGSINEDVVSVMIMNRATKASSYVLKLNNATASINQSDTVVLNINANSDLSFSGTIEALATHTLVFKKGKIFKTVYTNYHFENELSPIESKL